MDMSAKPNNLIQGDRVAIVATARKIELSELEGAIKLFESWGLEVVLGETIGKEEDQFAGSDSLRAKDFQRFLDDNTIKAIFCARGGYGSVRIIDKLDFSAFEKNPKWIIGYSDPTVILSHIYFNYNIQTIHGIMPLNIDKDNLNSPATESLRECLFNGIIRTEHNASKLNRFGEAEGELLGGNLSVLYSLVGSKSFGETKDKILFIEDLDEYLYHIDRIMQCFKRAGKLSGLRGLIVGAFTDMHDNTIPFGKSAQEIILESVREYDYPIVFDVPSGHIGSDNISRIIGSKTRLISREEEVIIEQ